MGPGGPGLQQPRSQAALRQCPSTCHVRSPPPALMAMGFGCHAGSRAPNLTGPGSGSSWPLGPAEEGPPQALSLWSPLRPPTLPSCSHIQSFVTASQRRASREPGRTGQPSCPCDRSGAETGSSPRPRRTLLTQSTAGPLGWAGHTDGKHGPAS